MANKPICKIKGCDKPTKGRGWCAGHYHRWTRHGDPLAGDTFVGQPRQFLEKALNSETDECIVWPFSKKTKSGYGNIRHNGRMVYVHRLCLELKMGRAIRPKMQAAHAPGICHNRLCVNPRHLREATVSQNNTDKEIDGTMPLGDQHVLSKLTAQQVLDIKRSDMFHRELAEIHGVVRQTIGDIKSGRTWAWLKSESDIIE